VKVRYSPRATVDLESIYRYLRERSPAGAVVVMTAIYAAVEFVKQNPQAAQATSISGVRVKIVRRYRFKIFYRLIDREAVVEIVHVRHTSRRPWTGE